MIRTAQLARCFTLLFATATLGVASGCDDGGGAGGNGGVSNGSSSSADGSTAESGSSAQSGSNGSSTSSSTGVGGSGGYADLSSLPADSGGTHTPHPRGSTDADYGYYLYLPGGYDATTQSYPLVVFLHGKGERGNGVAELSRVLKLGIPDIIEAGGWAPTYPMIVASPQYPSPDNMGNDNNWGEGDPLQIKGFIEHVMANYRINSTRIYLTGLSHGGNGVFDYLTRQEEATSHIAAAAPIAAYGPNSSLDTPLHTPIWVFVGSDDTTNFNTSKNFVTKYNAQVPGPQYPAKFTVYPGAGHDVWKRTYDLSGLGTADPAYDPYDMSLYDWMFQYKRAN